MPHTPGPWNCDYASDYEFEINAEVGNGKWKAVAIVTANRLGSEGVTKTENEANARLIAAAPELLAALEATIDYAERFVEKLNDQMVGDLYPAINAAKIQRARAAIAKARGQ